MSREIDRGAAMTEGAGPDLAAPPREATVITVTNQKGGVGKTTTAVSLGAALAGAGARVLLVDLDPQGNASTGVGFRAAEGDPSTYRVLVEQLPILEAIRSTEIERFDLLASSLDLAGAEIELVSAFSREQRLKHALAPVRARYDVVLVDCPPSLGLLTVNALVAADQVLVPIQCEYYALEGLGQLMRTVRLVGDSLNPELRLAGVVLTMFDGRTNLAQQVVDEVRDYFGDVAYDTIIPRTVRLSEAPSFGQPIALFDASSRGARAYERLAREVAGRLGLELHDQADSALDRLLGPEAPAPPIPVPEGELPRDLRAEDLEGLVPGGAAGHGGADDRDERWTDGQRTHQPVEGWIAGGPADRPDNRSGHPSDRWSDHQPDQEREG